MPTLAPAVAPAEQATLLVARDTDGTLVPEVLSLPLPKDEGARARALVDKLLEMYGAPDALHPVPGSPQPVQQVFLLAAEDPGTRRSSGPGQGSGPGGELAVVNLSAAFADGHPSGILTEMLTVESICGTLRANLPHVVQVRFLVGGQPRATLAGHADLSRTYLAADVAAANPSAGSPVSDVRSGEDPDKAGGPKSSDSGEAKR